MSHTLTKIIDNLKTKTEVDAVFITGSQGDEHKPYSDIDLVIILNKHAHDLPSLYTWIDDTFADIFFFDHADLERIATSKELPSNAMDAVLVSWLHKATIQFDKSGKLTDLKGKRNELDTKAVIPKSEKVTFKEKINYNLIANTRYFYSNDPLYHEALEMRFLYSISEVFMGYFEFRDILWRGEKAAIKYLKENDVNFYNAFMGYAKATNLSDKFEKYTALVGLVFTAEYTQWKKGNAFPQVKDKVNMDSKKLIEYWNGLIN